MKILHVMGGGDYGGTERQMERLACALIGEGFAQRVLMSAAGARAARLREAGIETVEMAFPSFLSFFDRRRIRAETARFGPDVVMSWTANVTALVEKGPYVHVGHLGENFATDTYASCGHLLAAAQVRADRAVSSGWPADRVTVIPRLLPVSAGAADVKPVERRVYFTPPKDKLIVCAARLVHAKGVETLIDALARLSGYYLWIAGEGEDRQAFEALAHERGVKPRVRFLGWHDDLAPILRAGDVFVYPARHEDLPDAVTEAWAAGVPVIAADSLGPGLVIRHNENGLLVPVGDPVNLAEAIKWVCQDRTLAARLAEAGQRAFQEAFATAKVLPEYTALMNRLVAAKASPAAAQ